MSKNNIVSLLSTGSVFVRAVVDGKIGKAVRFGNSDGLDIAHNVTSIEEKEFNSGNFNTIDSVVTEQGADLTLNIRSFSSEELAIGMFSKGVKTVESTTKDLTFDFDGEGYYPLGLVKSIESVTAGDLATATESYEWDGVALWLNEDAAEVGDVVTVSAVVEETKQIDAMGNSDTQYILEFVGNNKAQGGEKIYLKARVKPEPMANLPLISGEAYGTTSINFKILKDATNVSSEGLYVLHKQK